MVLPAVMAVLADEGSKVEVTTIADWVATAVLRMAVQVVRAEPEELAVRRVKSFCLSTTYITCRTMRSNPLAIPYVRQAHVRREQQAILG